MSTGLDCHIYEKDGKWFYDIEDPSSNRLDPDYVTHGPFASVAEMKREFRRMANPGGWSLTCADADAFEREWEAAR